MARKRFVSFIAMVMVFATAVLAVFAEIIYDPSHVGSPYNRCVVTDYTYHKDGVVSIKGSYNDMGYHCYRGRERYYRVDNWGGGFEYSSWVYTSYATGPNDGAIRTKTLRGDHAIVNRYEITFYANFYWVPDGASVWPVSIEEPA